MYYTSKRLSFPVILMGWFIYRSAFYHSFETEVGRGHQSIEKKLEVKEKKESRE